MISKSVCVLWIIVFSYAYLPIDISIYVYCSLSLGILMLGNKGWKGWATLNFKLVLPLICIALVGLTGVFYDYKERDILRDVGYSLTPIALIYLGNWVAGCGICLKELLKSIILISIILTMTHLSTFTPIPESLGMEFSKVNLVESYPSGELVVLALVVGLFQRRIDLGNLFPPILPRNLICVLFALSILLSYSRVQLVTLAILSLALLGKLHRIRPLFIFAVISIGIMYLTFSTVSANDFSVDFVTKIFRSLDEVSIRDYESYEEITYNWRGFETYRIQETYMSGSMLQKIVGQGVGSLVDLGFTMNLAGTDYDYIAVVHNGYGYLLLKQGLVGLLLYLTFYLNIVSVAMRHSRSNNREKKYNALLLLGIILSLIFSMYVVGGMAQAHSAEFVILIGYLTRRLMIERDISPILDKDKENGKFSSQRQLSSSNLSRFG